MVKYSGEIVKIAIVAEPRWEPLALAFSGAGVRRAPVKMFPPNELAEHQPELACALHDLLRGMGHAEIVDR